MEKNEIEDKPVKFSINLKRDEDPHLFISGLEECLLGQLEVLSIREIESLSQALISCSASQELYFAYFAQPHNLPTNLYGMIEEIVPSKNYIHPGK